MFTFDEIEIKFKLLCNKQLKWCDPLNIFSGSNVQYTYVCECALIDCNVAFWWDVHSECD